MTNLNAEKEATTGAVQLLFHNSKEQATVFHFACSSAGQPSGTLTTNAMLTHNIALPTTPTEQGVLITGANTTLTCAGGFARTTVTVSIIGGLDESCGQTKTAVKLTFTASSHGVQTPMEYTGVKYDLEAATNQKATPVSTTGYKTAAWAGTVTLTFDQKVKPAC